MVQPHKSKERSIVHRAQELAGYEHLRPGQESALRAISSGHDTLVIMPTGSGKSFIYQAAGNLIAGPTIVISPLIALQSDQAHMIEEHHLGEAESINSTKHVRKHLCTMISKSSSPPSPSAWG